MSHKKEEPKIITLNLTEQSIKYEAKRREALALINSGFGLTKGLDRPFAQKEIELGKTGLLYGDDQNNITAGTYPNIDTAKMFTHIWKQWLGYRCLWYSH